MRKTSIIKSCIVCNNPFKVHQYSIRNGNGKYCSRQCCGASMKNKPNGRAGEKRPTYVGEGNCMHREDVRTKHLENVRRGSSHPSWKGGVTPLYKMIRKSPQYISWRTAVFERDGYTCSECGLAPGHGKRVDLQADHIKPFAMYPELRFDVDNGRTMCIPCHKLTDTYGGKTLKLIKEGASNGNV